jgi:hypothetical protein
LTSAQNILVPEHLSQKEFLLLCDVFNGTSFDDDTPLRSFLAASVQDAISTVSIHEKWSVDPDELFLKLDDLGELSFVLVYAIMEYWNKYSTTQHHDDQDTFSSVS